MMAKRFTESDFVTVTWNPMYPHLKTRPQQQLAMHLIKLIINGIIEASVVVLDKGSSITQELIPDFFAGGGEWNTLQEEGSQRFIRLLGGGTSQSLSGIVTSAFQLTRCQKYSYSRAMFEHLFVFSYLNSNRYNLF